MLQTDQKPIIRYLVPVGGVAAATALSWISRRYIGSAHVPLVYLLVIVVTATMAGVGPAILAAILSFLAWNFLFIDPVHTFYVRDPRDWLALLTFLIVGTVCGQLAGRARQAGRFEAVRESDKLKSAMLSSVSHDLRTPLSSILASVTSLLESESRLDTVSRRELLQSIHESALRLDDLVGDLLDLSSIEAGMWQPGKELNHLTNVIGTVLARFDEASNKRVEVNFPPDLPPIHMDYVQIVQVLWNLLDNALKYSPSDTSVRVSGQRNARAVTVSVRDSGPGIVASERERVFEKFYRAQRQVTSRVPGTGMGLAICKGIIEAHGGSIWVDGNTEPGTTFSFTLPIPADENRKKALPWLPQRHAF